MMACGALPWQPEAPNLLCLPHLRSASTPRLSTALSLHPIHALTCARLQRNMADFSYSDDTELQALNNAVLADPDEFENWEKLVRAAETQEDGNTLNRNSSPQAIAATRNVYDSFLGRFPLFFGMRPTLAEQ